MIDETNWKKFFWPVLIGLGLLSVYRRNLGLGNLAAPLVVVLFFCFFMLLYGRRKLRKPLGLDRLLLVFFLFAVATLTLSRADWLERIPDWLLIVLTLAVFTSALFLRRRKT